MNFLNLSDAHQFILFSLDQETIFYACQTRKIKYMHKFKFKIFRVPEQLMRAMAAEAEAAREARAKVMMIMMTVMIIMIIMIR